MISDIYSIPTLRQNVVFTGLLISHVYFLAPFTRHREAAKLSLEYMRSRRAAVLKTAQAIKNRIEKKGPGSLWSPKDFPDFPARTVAKTLSRLSEKGFLTKIKQGTYFFGKETPLGRTMPQATAIVEKLHNRKFTGGLHAFYNLGLTRQVPATLTIVSSSRRHIPKTRTLRRNIDHLKGASDQEFWILEALRKIKTIPDCPPQVAVTKIGAYIAQNKISIKRLVRFALSEPPRVRALLGAICQDIGIDSNELLPLRKSLNQLTSYKIGIANSLKRAKEWNIE